MKKLGLCVRYDCDNYGSMLQILATQKAVEKAGWDYEIIRYNKKNLSFLIKNVTRVFNPYFMRGKLMSFNKNRKLKKYPEVQEGNRRRLVLFRNYRKTYIGPYSKEYKGFKNLCAGAKTYDAVMVGSDQLWTPAGIRSKFYNLLFVPDQTRKISFATSFGVSSVPASQIQETKKYLSRIDHLSVREIAGAKIVKELTGREAVIALDPTLLFDGQEWLEIFPEEKIIEEPYIFAYFLGETIKHREVVESLAKETGLKIITCPQMDTFVEKDLTFGDERRFDIDPLGFLNLIRGATYVCTDSFHGSVFSILNHKQFLTFNRFEEGSKQSRNSRIDSLFGLLGLEKRRYSIDSDYIRDILDSPIDYVKVEEKLRALRQESFDFLSTALK